MLKRRIGGKIIGRGWNGRACRAVMSVARRVGGRGDSMESVRRVGGGELGCAYCPSPLRMKWLSF